MAADIKELEAAFVKADDAGNTEDAQAFATEIKRLRGAGFESTPGGAAVGNPAMRPKNTWVAPDNSGEAMSKIGGAAVGGAALNMAAPQILRGIGGMHPALRVPALALENAARSYGPGSRALTGAVSGVGGEAAGQGADAVLADQNALVRGVGGEAARLAGGVAAPAVLEGTANLARRFSGSFIGRSIGRLYAGLTKGVDRELSGAEKQYMMTSLANLRGGEPTYQDLEEIGKMMGKGADDALSDAERGARIWSQLAQQELQGADRNAESIIGQAQQSSGDTLNRYGDRAKQILDGAQSRAGAVTQQADSTAAAKEAQIKAAADAQTSSGNQFSQGLQQLAGSSEGMLQRVGNPNTTPSAIGEGLRDVIVPRNQKMLDARSTQIQTDKDTLAKQLADREAAGNTIERLPEYKALLAKLDRKTLATPEARMTVSKDTVGDPGLMSASATVRKAVTEKTVLVDLQEYNDALAAGLPVKMGGSESEPVYYRVFPTSQQALDNVRRKLGEVYRGKPPEGYGAIGKLEAEEYYRDLRDIQVKHGGTLQAKILDDYHLSSSDLEKFLIGRGKKATAADRFDPEAFKTDASKLPGEFFQSKQGVQDLLKLTGDPAVVNRAAKDYVAMQLAGKNEEAVRKWIADPKNRDWLTQLPEVYKSVAEYSSNLSRIHSLAGRAAAVAKTNAGTAKSTMTDALEQVAAARTAAGKDASEILTAGGSQSTLTINRGASEADRILAEGNAAAGEVRAQGALRAETNNAKATAALDAGNATAKVLLMDKEEVPRAVHLIMNGKPSDWAIAGPVIAKSPGAQAVMEKAVRQANADALGNNPTPNQVATATAYFKNNLRPALERSNLMTADAADRIERLISGVSRMPTSEEVKHKYLKRLLNDTLSGYSAGLASRTLVNAIPSTSPNYAR